MCPGNANYLSTAMFLKKIFSAKNSLFLVGSGIILLVFFFLRFYLIEQRTIFNWDQARDAQTVSQILSGKPTLIGPRVLGPDKFFLGPYFYYLLAPFYLVTQGSAIAIVWFLACYNIVFVILFWLIIKKLFSAKIAFWALFLWAVNPSLVSNDIISWNPVLIPLVVVTVWYWCWLGLKKNNKFAWPLLGLTLGLGVNFHFQMIFLIPFVVLFFSFNKRVFNLKKAFLSIVGFLISFLPLFLFDLRHNFLNSRLFVKFLTAREASKDITAWLPALANFINGLIGSNLSSILALIFFVSLALIFFFKSKKENAKSLTRSFFLATFGLFLITLVGFAFYGARPSEYYFNFLAPFIIIFLANIFSQKRVGQIILVIIALFWFSLSLNKLKPLPFSLANKRAAVDYLIQNFNQKKVNIAFSVPASEDTSYIYLINQKGYQIDSSAGPQYKIIVPSGKEPVSVVVGGIGLFLPQPEE